MPTIEMLYSILLALLLSNSSRRAYDISNFFSSPSRFLSLVHGFQSENSDKMVEFLLSARFSCGIERVQMYAVYDVHVPEIHT